MRSCIRTKLKITISSQNIVADECACVYVDVQILPLAKTTNSTNLAYMHIYKHVHWIYPILLWGEKSRASEKPLFPLRNIIENISCAVAETYSFHIFFLHKWKKKRVLCTWLYAVAKIYVKGSCVNKSLQLNFSDAFISTLLFYPKENKSQVSL